MTTMNVLIVDDELGMRLGAERSLSDFVCPLQKFNEEINFKSFSVETGKEALKFLEINHVDLLLLDHKLPDMLGLEILTRVRENNSEIMTIMITAYAALDLAISATKNGAFDFLAKPFTPDELKNVVEKAARHLFLKQKAQNLEQEKRQVRFEFIKILAHELKSPLAAVENYLYLIRDKIAGNDINKYENMISRSLVRMQGMRKLIMDLLDLTHFESGQKKRDFSRINLFEIAQAAMESVQRTAKEKSITLEIDCQKDLKVFAVKDEMEIIFNNLISNAVKYNNEKGKVEISINRSETEFSIKCQDTGIGMTDEEIKKLFKEFSRIKNEKTQNIPGSGLGLSILKKIAESYRGKINVQSAPGKGTLFELILKEEKEKNS